MSTTAKGIIYLLIAAFSSSICGVLSRYIYPTFSGISQITYRFSIMFLIFFTFTLVTHNWRPIKKSDLPWFLLMVFPGFLGSVLIYLAFNHLTLGTVYFGISATSTIFSFLFGWLLFSEIISRGKLISLLLCLIGLFLIFYNTYQAHNLIYLISIIIIALGSSCWYAFSKKLSSYYPISQILTLDAAIIMVSSWVITIIGNEVIIRPSLTIPWISIMGYALAAIIAGIFTIWGFKYLQIQIGSLIVITENVFALIWGTLLFRETLTPLMLLGSTFILLGAALPNINLNKPAIS